MAQCVEMIKRVIEEVKSRHYDTPSHLYQNIEVPSNICYLSNCCNNKRTALHSGQRKLFNALLYFLTKYAKDGDICVYIGSAPGDNILAIAEIFPTLTFRLYDPKKTKQTNLKNVIIVTNEKGDGSKFTNLTIKELFPEKNRILLFSDIRNTDNKGNITEVIVHSDLEIQKEWVKDLQPKAFCLKFRIPYVDSKKVKTTSISYFDGFGLLQPYSPQTTTEIRLMNSGVPKMITWGLNEHENKMFYINTILREWAFYENVDNDVIGGDNCFDCALETFLCKSFLESDLSTSALRLIKPFQGKTNISKLRNWISNFDKMRLQLPPKPKIQNDFNHIRFEPLYTRPHGTLPHQSRDIIDFLNVTDPIKLLVDILIKRGKINKPQIEIVSILKTYKDLIYEAITHKSMNSTHNYEKLEFRGDRILSNCLADYFYEKTDTSDISVLNGLLSAFTSGEVAIELFANRLGLKQIVVINEEETDCGLDKAVEDVFEAVLGAINKIFDSKYRKGIGMMVCYNIIESILNEIDFENFKYKIFPPKTELKELFNEHQHTLGFIFEKQYTVTIGDKYDTIHDCGAEKIRVTINNLPPNYTPPPYEEYGLKSKVERNAALLFLEFYKNRGLISRPKYRELIFFKK